MRCVLFFYLSVVLGLAAGYPQRHAPQFELHHPALGSFNPFLAAADPARRHRDLVDESPETDSTFGQRGFDRPDYGLADFDTPYSPSFTDMMTQMQEMMVRLRQEMNEILRRLPASGSDDAESALIPATDNGFDLSNVKNQTTSKTEYIDGQKVTINQTVYRSGNDLMGTILKVRTISVVPHEGDTPSEVTPESDQDEVTPPANDSVEESDEQLIPVTRTGKNDDNNEIPIEKMQLPYRYAVPDQVEQHLNEIQSNEIGTNDVDGETKWDVPNRPRSLKDDTAVNYIAANRKRGSIMMIPSDVEMIGVDAPQQNQYYKYDFAADSQAPSLDTVAESMENFGDVELGDGELP